MSARSKARKAALDLLYESDIRRTSASDLLLRRVTDMEYVIRDFTKELVDGVDGHRRKIDELITTYSQGWDMDRMPVIDRNILRLAIYEVLWSSDVPAAVAISEALDLRKLRALLQTPDEFSRLIYGLLNWIAIKREDWNGEVLSIRYSDIETLGIFTAKTENELAQALNNRDLWLTKRDRV